MINLNLCAAAWRRVPRLSAGCRAMLLAATSSTAMFAAIAGPARVCTPPVVIAATTGAFVLGDGTPQSCTAALLQAAVTAYPIVTFNCGAAPVTIPVTTTINVPITRNTVIDGGGKVTLDGGGRVRILDLYRANFRTSNLGLTLQHITLANGHAIGTRYVAPSATNPSCSYGWADGGGGAIYLRDSVLHVIDVSLPRQHVRVARPRRCRRGHLCGRVARRGGGRLHFRRQFRLERWRNRPAAERRALRERPVLEQQGHRHRRQLRRRQRRQLPWRSGPEPGRLRRQWRRRGHRWRLRYRPDGLRVDLPRQHRQRVRRRAVPNGQMARLV